MVEVAPAQRSAERPGFVVITEDGSGIAAAFSARLAEQGIRSATISHAPAAGVDLRNAESVSKLVESLRAQHGAIDGLAHLMPLAPFSAEDAAASIPSNIPSNMDARTRLDLDSLYLLTKALEKDLRGSKAGALLSATRLGGSFGFASSVSEDFFPGSGAISGFVKTVSREWTELLARTVDFEPAADTASLANTLVDEVLSRDGWNEVGYKAGKRIILKPSASPVIQGESQLKLDRESVVLVTGGARGITASIAIELAREYHPRFVLVGRSPLPPATEPADIAGITDPRQLRAAIMDRTQTGGQRVTPAMISGQVKRITNEREIRSTVALLGELGTSVEYHAADVADEATMAGIIQSVYEKYGRIDGVIHGAGLIEDKLIEDKTPESFDRVVRPKVTGGLALASNLRPEGLRFLVFFSSVSARYGNRGQCDYSAANEVLNKLAVSLNAKWPGRVVSMNWGPWRTEGGMVSPQLAARFAAAGVEMIETLPGCHAFLQELKYGRKQDAEVVFGGPLRTDQQTPAQSAQAAAPRVLPLVGSVGAQGSGPVRIEAHPQKHVFLLDHQLDDKPVLPMVVAMEILAEAAIAAHPNGRFSAVKNVKNLQGVTFPNAQTGRTLLVESTPSSGNANTFDVTLKSAEKGQLHYRGQVEFDGPAQPPPPRLHLVNPKAFPLPIPDAYEQWLFHGPMFAGIFDILAMGDNGIIGRLRPTPPEKIIRDMAPGSAWVIDPVVADSCLQLGLLWSRAMFDMTPLPAAIESYHHVAPLHSAKQILCEIDIISKPGSPTLRCLPAFYDENDRILGWMDRVECNMSKALNRLSGKRTGSPGTVTKG